jgi:hypothetical protein
MDKNTGDYQLVRYNSINVHAASEKEIVRFIS